MSLTRSERERLIQQYADGPARLEAALGRVPAGALQWRPAAGEWSAHEVAVHCADSETNAAARIRYLLCEPQPVVLAYDEVRDGKPGMSHEQAMTRLDPLSAVAFDPAIIETLRKCGKELDPIYGYEPPVEPPRGSGSGVRPARGSRG